MDEKAKAQLFAKSRQKAVADPEISLEVDNVGLSPEEFQKHLDDKKESLWVDVAEQVAEVDRLDQSLQALRKRALKEVEATGQSMPGAEDDKVEAPLAGEAAAQQAGEAAAPRGPLDRVLRRSTPEERRRQANEHVDQLLQQHPSQKSLIEQRNGALESLETTLVHVMVAELRKKINMVIRDREKMKRYGAPLQIHYPRRLREPVSAQSRVRTQAMEDLAALLDRLPQGSIGIAGPRGCGKSTILDERCAGSMRGDLRIAVSAPVDYVPREFLLYLYRRLCEEVLRLAGVADQGETEAHRPSTRQRGVRIALMAASTLACIVGLLLTTQFAMSYPISDMRRALPLAAIILAVAAVVVVAGQLSASAISQGLAVADLPSERDRAVDAFDKPAPLVDSLPQRGRAFGPFDLQQSAPTPRTRPAVTSVSAVLASVVLVAYAQDWWSWLTERRVVGLVLVLVAVPVFLAGRRLRPDDLGSRDDGDGTGVIVRSGVIAALLVVIACGVLFVFLPADVFDPDARLVAGGALLVGGVATLQIARLKTDAQAWTTRNVQLRYEGEGDVKEAIKGLQRLRYQRSFATGWSSTIKLAASSYVPFGVDAGLTSTTTETELPWTVPDITDRIEALLGTQRTAVVGIDELDKIESDENARAFLNEIKGVFSAPRTHFLVSMSEDAIASFERRGLAFRDVFDSAFDEIVRVPYLSLHESRELVNKRVIGVPPPFLDLAHCLSGGLARDLIRALDQLVGLKVDDHRLGPVTRVVVHHEIATKLQAVASALRPVPLEPQVTNVLKALYRIDSCPEGKVVKTQCVLRSDWLNRVYHLDLGTSETEGSDLPALRTLQRLAGEYTGFSYYCRTLIEFFEKAGRAVKLFEQAETAPPSNPIGLDYLARARQNLAVNPHLAWEQISNFREENELPRSSFPRSLLGSRDTTQPTPAPAADTPNPSVAEDPRTAKPAQVDAGRTTATSGGTRSRRRPATASTL
jgi:hypothetical protein